MLVGTAPERNTVTHVEVLQLLLRGFTPSGKMSRYRRLWARLHLSMSHRYEGATRALSAANGARSSCCVLSTSTSSYAALQLQEY